MSAENGTVATVRPTLADLLDRCSAALVDAVIEVMDVGPDIERVEVVQTVDRSTMAVVVSWDPDEEGTFEASMEELRRRSGQDAP